MKSTLEGKILVTGGAGLIGSAVVWALNQRGIDNILISDFLGSDEKWKNLVPLRYRDYVEADQLLTQLSSPRLNDVTCIFHLGACSATTEKNVSYLMQNNYDYTRRLAEWSLEKERRFVYASSAATYGDGSAGMVDGHDLLQNFRPLNAYGYSKHLFDLHARKEGWLSQLVGLKYFNIFGPNEDHKGDMRSVVHKAYSQIRDEKKVKLFKSYHPDFRDGEQQRDFLYVKEAVAMTLHLAETSSAAGLYNIGSGKPSTWIDLVTPMFKALDLPPKIDFIEMPEVLRGKYQYHTCADISRLRDTGWKLASPNLADSVTDYVANYLVPHRHLGE
ncbi:MAG: ADP-glyceromanno-heptose 6-epimerase [Blastochloris sp.]|nr:ADP-glyceromanno-heptose 6-epimerase [Blastochloris sp.]